MKLTKEKYLGLVLLFIGTGILATVVKFSLFSGVSWKVASFEDYFYRFLEIAYDVLILFGGIFALAGSLHFIRNKKVKKERYLGFLMLFAGLLAIASPVPSFSWMLYPGGISDNILFNIAGLVTLLSVLPATIFFLLTSYYFLKDKSKKEKYMRLTFLPADAGILIIILLIVLSILEGGATELWGIGSRIYMPLFGLAGFFAVIASRDYLKSKKRIMRKRR